MKKLILFSLLTVLLMSCGKFSDGTSVWQDGLIIIPLLTGLGSLIFFYIAWLKSKSGSEQQTPTGYKYSDKNVPLYKIGQFWYSVALAVATIVIIIMVNADK